MKIVNIMLGKNKGGLEQMALTYATALHNLGHECLCVLPKKSPYVADFMRLGVDVLPIKHTSRYHLPTIINTLRHIQQYQPDCIIMHGNRAISFIINKIARLFCPLSCPVISVAHSAHLKYTDKVDGIICLTQDTLQKYNQKGYFLPNTIYEKIHTASPLHTPITLGIMGRLHRAKGIDILLESCAILNKKGIDFHLKIAGTGPELEALKNQVSTLNLSKKISFLGWIEDKASFFNDIDIFCMSSRLEPFGLTVLEAFAYAKPVVSFDISGPASILSYTKNPLIASPENAADFADKCTILLQNPTLIKQMGQNGQDVFTHHFAPAIFEKNLNLILHKITLKV